MLMKFNYFLATLFVYLNFINNAFCCNPTTLTVWKFTGVIPSFWEVMYGYEARIEVRNEGSTEFTHGDAYSFKEKEINKYQNMASKDGDLIIYGSWAKQDITYSWGGRSQYLEKPVSIETKGKSGCKGFRT
ncbi:unnamed protein product [Cunninghamella blakesleeana]